MPSLSSRVCETPLLFAATISHDTSSHSSKQHLQLPNPLTPHSASVRKFLVETPLPTAAIWIRLCQTNRIHFSQSFSANTVRIGSYIKKSIIINPVRFAETHVFAARLPPSGAGVPPVLFWPAFVTLLSL